MIVAPNWHHFRAKFSGNSQGKFEWLCYLLFCNQFNKKEGVFRYKNQSAIETEPIQVSRDVIGWQAKFYDGPLYNHKDELLEMLNKCTRDYPNLNRLILYTNAEWGQVKGKEPKGKKEIDIKAKSLGINLEWKTESYFESEFVVKDNYDISRYFFTEEKEILSLDLYEKLNNFYTAKFKNTELLESNHFIKTNQMNCNIIQIDEDDISDTIDYDEEKSFNNVIKLYDSKETMRLFITGKAGMGKTALCKYIAYMWSINELFQDYNFVIYLPLTNWENFGLLKAVRNQYYSLDSEIDLSVLLNEHKILFLFDGYDELNTIKKQNFKDELEKYNFNNYIITSQEHGYIKKDFQIEQHLMIYGFSNNNITEYINTFFTDIKKKELVNSYVNNNSYIKEIARTPLLLEIICSLFDAGSMLKPDVTRTELYTKIIKYLLNDHTYKKSTTHILDEYTEILNILGELALNGLLQNNYIINLEDIKNKRKGFMTFFDKYLLKTGFLKSDNNNQVLIKNSYQFAHSTFQDYFAAYYLSKKNDKEIQYIINKYKFFIQTQNLFVFLSGLIDDKDLLFNTLYNDSSDIIGFNRLLLTLDCLSQIKNNKITTRTLIDLSITTWLNYCINNNISVNLLLSKITSKQHLIYLINELPNDKFNEKILCFTMLVQYHSLEVENILKEEILSNDHSKSFIDHMKIFLIKANIIIDFSLIGIEDILNDYTKNKENTYYSTNSMPTFSKQEISRVIDTLTLFDEKYITKLEYFSETELEKDINKINEEIEKNSSNSILESSIDNITLDETYELLKSLQNESINLEPNVILNKIDELLILLKVTSDSLLAIKTIFNKYCHGEEFSLDTAIVIYRKGCHDLDLIEFIVSSIEGEIKNREDDRALHHLAYKLDKLAFTKNNNNKIINLLLNFIENTFVQAKNKFDIAKGLYLYGYINKKIVVTLIEGICHSNTSWNMSIDEIWREEFVGILCYDYSFDSSVNVEPGLMITNNKKNIMKISCFIKYINEYDLLKDRVFIDNNSFNILFINAFVLDNKPLFISSNQKLSTIDNNNNTLTINTHDNTNLFIERIRLITGSNLV